MTPPVLSIAIGADRFASLPAHRRGLRRDAVRLMTITGRRDDPTLVHRHFRDLGDELRPGDLLVVNNSAMTANAIDAYNDDGAVVIHVGSPLGTAPRSAGGRRVNPHRYVVEIRCAPAADAPVLGSHPGAEYVLGTRDAGRAASLGGSERLTLLEPYRGGGSPTGQGNRLWVAELTNPLDRLSPHIERRPIRYGYTSTDTTLADYHSVFSTQPGSSEMASAAMPFTVELIDQLAHSGVGIAPITLHTGLSSQEQGEPPQSERFLVGHDTAARINAARAGGHRVIAVGTTSARAVESAVSGGQVVATHGWTDHLITADTPPQVVSGLITGWHDVGASHISLVEAVAGERATQLAYQLAADSGYLWHEFGDSALFLTT